MKKEIFIVMKENKIYMVFDTQRKAEACIRVEKTRGDFDFIIKILDLN